MCSTSIRSYINQRNSLPHWRLLERVALELMGAVTLCEECECVPLNLDWAFTQRPYFSAQFRVSLLKNTANLIDAATANTANTRVTFR